MTRLLLPSVLVLAACGPQSARVSEGDEQGQASSELTLEPGSAAQILALVNYPGTDLAVLDQQAGLDARAAANVIAHRDGADKLALTSDDELFDTIAELDTLPYVGDTAFQKLLAFAQAHPAPSAENVEGVAFAGWEAELVVWGVNTAPTGTLDGLLDARAAANLVAARPFATVTQMGPLGYVGPTALERLRRQALTWWNARRNGPVSLAGTFDGVSFDEATATGALELVNAATLAQLTAAGVYSTGANAIVAGRPFTSLAAVAALAGVGTSSMQAIAKAALSWGAPPATLLEVQTALVDASADLWMPSETDARFVLLTGTQLNGAAITVEEVRAQLTAQHDQLIATVMYTDPSERSLAAKTLVEERAFPAFFDRIIEGADPNDPISLANAQKFEHLKQVIAAHLTDVKVYRFGRISISTFIVGRAPSGELVALLTGQVET